MFACVPILILLARRQNTVEDETLAAKDQRVKVMNEVLQGIKVVKFFAWEQKLTELIAKVRSTECSYLRSALLLMSSSDFVSQCIATVGSVVTFTVFALAGGTLTTPLIFSVLTLFNIMSWPLYNLQSLGMSFIQAQVSAARVFKFLMAEEVQKPLSALPCPYLDPEEKKLHKQREEENAKKHNVQLFVAESETSTSLIQSDLDDQEKNNESILVKNASFAWKRDDEHSPLKDTDYALHEVDLNIKKGEKIIIIGTVGAGKTTLLKSLFGETYQVKGFRCTRGTIAYCDQTPWVINATIRDNILFGKPYREDLYQRVLQISELNHDLDLFVAKDLTEIGENGVNLSGGQKHRCLIARALYSNADIFLLDSVLNSVDANVQKSIFENAIMGDLLREKTVLISMHSLQFLQYVNRVIILRHGRIVACGPYKELQDAGYDFKDYVDDEEEVSTEPAATSEASATIGDSNSFEISTRPAATVEISQSAEAENSAEASEAKEKDKAKLITEEDRAVCTVGFKIYRYYFSFYGAALVIAIAISSIASKVFQYGINAWLSVWSSGTFPSLSVYQNLLIYNAFIVGMSVFIWLVNILFSIGSLKSSNAMHNAMLKSIFHAPLLFFNQNPVGRILNRFSKDLYSIDYDVALNFAFLLSCILNVASVVIVICIVTPLFVFLLVPIVALYYLIQRYYRNSSRELRRLESISKSPIFSHFTECINGSSSVRAYKYESILLEQSISKINTHLKVMYTSFAANRWLGVRLQLVASLIVLGASVFGVFSSLNPAYIGLSISYSLTVSNSLIWLIRMSVDIENYFTSVERVSQYITGIPQERPYFLQGEEEEANKKKKHNSSSQSWPSEGHIDIKDLKVKYRDDLEYVLKGINCSIKPGERIGIVGRTGAGKSSLVSSLFRLIEASEGSIEIDNVDIATVGLHKLRSNLTIIPQEPFTVSGSLRKSLDFFDEHSDAEIWSALEKVNLKSFVESLKQKLEEPLAEGGSNISIGQQSLLSMARSILRNSKIVVLDELNIDMECDKIIQQSIRNDFKSSTVLIIAHRLESIIDCTRILVLDSGQVVEFDTPLALLQNEHSYFKKLVDDTGAKHANYLMQKVGFVGTASTIGTQ